MNDFQAELGGDLLASVSRSFYLSLKFMPGTVRGAASLAYLLARATDTVADTEAVEAEHRLELLGAMGEAVARGGGAPDFGEIAAVGESLSEGEVELLGKFSRCLEWLAELPERQRVAIVRVLGPIVRGQSDDLRRFSTEQVTALGNDEELEQYTYDVAGCVGVFWTELGFGAYDDAYADLPRSEMESLGERFGKGLQLLNILRDLPEDLEAGRCYLPGGDVSAGAGAIWDGEGARWRARCRELLEAAPVYVDALRNRRMRFATALPALLAGRTLALLEAASWQQLEGRLKVPRSQIKPLLARAALASVPRGGLGRLCRREFRR